MVLPQWRLETSEGGEGPSNGSTGGSTLQAEGGRRTVRHKEHRRLAGREQGTPRDTGVVAKSVALDEMTSGEHMTAKLMTHGTLKNVYLKGGQERRRLGRNISRQEKNRREWSPRGQQVGELLAWAVGSEGEYLQHSEKRWLLLYGQL